MAEISTVDALGELIALCEDSVEVRAIVRELVNECPVVGGLEIDFLATRLAATDHMIMRDQASERVLRCLAAATAGQIIPKPLGRTETHSDISPKPEPNLPIGDGFVKCNIAKLYSIICLMRIMPPPSPHGAAFAMV